MSPGSVCTMTVFTRPGDVVTRNGDETELTDKHGRRFMKAENALPVGAHVRRERLNLGGPRALIGTDSRKHTINYLKACVSRLLL